VEQCLSSRVVLITGAASGIGRRIAETFRSAGAHVIASDLQGAQWDVGDTNGDTPITPCTLDVTKPEDWRDVLGRIERQFGALDVLVNNAGMPFHGSIEDTELDEWRRVQAVNAEGVFLGCKYALPLLKSRGRGSIINISSVAAVRAESHGVAYSAAKAAVVMISRCVALYCGKEGYPVRCNTILPGMIKTPMLDFYFSNGVDPATVEERLARRVPLKRIGAMDEIAQTALFLASDAAGYINGTEILVDGGWSI
jgi:3(or 17)beta-hydroxysteroid dehydrogenase